MMHRVRQEERAAGTRRKAGVRPRQASADFAIPEAAPIVESRIDRVPDRRVPDRRVPDRRVRAASRLRCPTRAVLIEVRAQGMGQA